MEAEDQARIVRVTANSLARGTLRELAHSEGDVEAAMREYDMFVHHLRHWPSDQKILVLELTAVILEELTS